MIEFLTGWTVQILVLIAGAAVIVVVMYAMMRALARPQLRVLPPELVGSEGTALTPISSREGKVDVAGSRIVAVSENPIDAGRKVRVVRIEGVVAKVEPA